MLIKGLHDRSRTSSHALFVFSGAVSNRNGAQPPFFSGLGISGEMGLPLISISDPSLALSESLALGFYGGNEACPDLAIRIAGMVDKISFRHGMTPILMGGSGGGFAALNVSRYCRSQPISFVWNPQTRISHYTRSAVDAYLKTAFPLTYREGNDVREKAEEILGASGVPHSLLDGALPRRVVYLQNRGDWHMRTHMAPFISRLGAERVERCGFYARSRDIAFFAGKWGKGHATPPRDMITQVLRLLSLKRTPLDILGELEASYAADAPPLTVFEDPGSISNTLYIKSSWEKERFRVALYSGNRTLDGEFEYAFQVEDGAGQETRTPYGQDPFAFFENIVPGRVKVKGFIRDELGITFSSSYIISDNSEAI